MSHPSSPLTLKRFFDLSDLLSRFARTDARHQARLFRQLIAAW